jgi:hypothetical protein
MGSRSGRGSGSRPAVARWSPRRRVWRLVGGCGGRGSVNRPALARRNPHRQVRRSRFGGIDRPWRGEIPTGRCGGRGSGESTAPGAAKSPPAGAAVEVRGIDRPWRSEIPTGRCGGRGAGNRPALARRNPRRQVRRSRFGGIDRPWRPRSGESTAPRRIWHGRSFSGSRLSDRPRPARRFGQSRSRCRGVCPFGRARRGHLYNRPDHDDIPTPLTAKAG